jgi:hypothetical protein
MGSAVQALYIISCGNTILLFLAYFSWRYLGNKIKQNHHSTYLYSSLVHMQLGMEDCILFVSDTDFSAYCLRLERVWAQKNTALGCWKVISYVES